MVILLVTEVAHQLALQLPAVVEDVHILRGEQSVCQVGFRPCWQHDKGSRQGEVEGFAQTSEWKTSGSVFFM